MDIRWKRIFPDMTEMPAIPEGFDDTSWHHDVCPSFTSDALGLTVWINYPKVEDRENGDANRFILHRQRSGVEHGMWVLASDRWGQICDAIEAKRICDKWVAVLGLGFHPDTPGDQYVIGGGVWDQDDAIDPNWALSAKQANQYELDMAFLFAAAIDPYEYGIMAIEDWEARQNDQRHAGMVARQLDSQKYL